MKLYNSLTKKIEEFVPLKPPNVGMYSCGMTVYDYAHIGHGRKYLNDDILRRALTFNGFKINHVQNVTDVGHLTSDADEGEDKIEKGAVKTGKTVWEVADFFTNYFYSSMDKLNILRPNIICKATEHISEQIELIKKIFANGYAYDTPEAVYFDTSKFKNYGDLFSQRLEEKKVAARAEVQKGQHKKNPQDFVLWFKRVGKFKNHVMHWDSPWGDGFPGWHIECSAMSMKYLGEQFDIHTGGEDHLSLHHPNEIAQSEGATGKHPFVKYWFHTAFLLVNGQKMSKSLGNFYTIEDVEKKGFSPMDLRYFYLGAHYRKQLNFTWEALEGAKNTLNNLRSIISDFSASHEGERRDLSEDKMDKVDNFRNAFIEAINFDLNTPQALSVLWEVVKSNIPSCDKLDLLYLFDEILGLKLKEVSNVKYQISKDIEELVRKREELREKGKFEEADEIRKKIYDLGFEIRDTKEGTKVKPKSKLL